MSANRLEFGGELVILHPYNECRMELLVIVGMKLSAQSLVISFYFNSARPWPEVPSTVTLNALSNG